MTRIVGSVVLLIFLLGCTNTPSVHVADTGKATPEKELIIGTVITLHSTLLREERPIIIALPDGYDTSRATYPVLYLTDGLQNIWHVMGTIEILARTGSIPPLIVVGIQSTNRIRDFTMTGSPDHPGSGGGHQFLAFIESELIPYVDSSYRTNPFRILEGHSLGGLFAASVFIENPALFNGIIIMSPSMWWNHEELTGRVGQFLNDHPHLDNVLFFGIGMGESGSEFGMRKELKNFVDVIAMKKPAGLRYELKEMEDEGHMSSTLLSNYYGLKFVFYDMAFPDSLLLNYSDESFLIHENRIMSKYGVGAKQSAESYVSLAVQLSGQERYSEASTVLKRSIGAYPYDVGLMNLLANTYEMDGRIDNAITTYQQALSVSRKYNYLREEEFQQQIDRLKNK